jgi:hypothetical protein
MDSNEEHRTGSARRRAEQDAPGAPTPEKEDEGTGPSPDRDHTTHHPDLQAEVRERADGAHAEQITDEANLRANPDPPP